MKIPYGTLLRDDIGKREIIPLIGVYDVFSATIAGRYFDGIFISGFGFSASFYGLPDVGFISWSDIVPFVQRVRTVLPDHHIVVDIDDGYADPEVACHVVSLLESIGASGIILEDQKRPRRCGHLDGKNILDLEEYIVKLRKVLATRKNLFVVARTDASGKDEIERRVKAFSEAGADAILVDGMGDIGIIRKLRENTKKPFAFNQINGGKSPPFSLEYMADNGVSLAIYSTPGLFAARGAIDDAMISLKESGGVLKDVRSKSIGVKECTSLLEENLARRDGQVKPEYLNLLSFNRK